MSHAAKRPSLGPVQAIVVATTALVLINAAAIALQSPPAGGAAVRALRHLFDAGQHLALGLLIAAIAAVLQRVGLGRRGAVIAVGVAAASLAVPLLSSDVSNFAWRVAPSFPKLVHLAVAVGVGLSFALAVWLGTVPEKPLHRAALASVGLGALAANHALLPADYAGVHLVVALMGITMSAAALSRAALPRGWPVVVRVTPWALASSLAAFCVGVWPGTPVVMELLRSDGSVVMPLLARAHAARTRTEAPIPVHSRAWFQPRASAPPVPPSRVVRLPGPPVVLLLSIDGLRADVVLEGKHDAHMPFLAQLRDGALAFEQARTPGAQTVYTVSSLFSCVYFSQLYWSEHRGNIWPAADETPRFPELLTRAQVRTFNVAPAPWLVNDIGVVRGFAEEVHTPPPRGTKYTPAATITDEFIAQLSKLGDGPAFGFTHYLDTHDGMRRGAPGDPEEEHDLIAHDEVNAASWVSLGRQFFDVHTLKRDGYVVPFRR